MTVVITKLRDDKTTPTLFMNDKGEYVSISNKEEFAANNIKHTFAAATYLFADDKVDKDATISLDLSFSEFHQFVTKQTINVISDGKENK